MNLDTMFRFSETPNAEIVTGLLALSQKAAATDEPGMAIYLYMLSMQYQTGALKNMMRGGLEEMLKQNPALRPVLEAMMASNQPESREEVRDEIEFEEEIDLK